MLPLGKNPGWGSGHGHIPLGHGHITIDGKITFIFCFGTRHLLSNFKKLSDMI